jgi:hypothetical protein
MKVALALGLALAAAPAEAKAPELQHRTLSSIPMTMFAQDCKYNSSANVAFRAQKAENPGAGMKPVEPFKRVLKDGFYQVACVKDSLHEFGDKHGNNAASYNMGDSAGVSIVHYTEVVPKMDQEPMTHEVCFSFCRTVPDMNFFGIHNGRDCYCEPYYQAAASDSSDCDATCEGAPYQMCGGKVKSSIFGMHACADGAEQLSQAADKATTAKSGLSGELLDLDAVAEAMQGSAATWQASLGQAGDPEASNLMQEAKVYAGELVKFHKEKSSVVDALTASITDAGALKGADMTTFANADKAEDVQAALEKLVAEAGDAAEATTELLKESSPTDTDSAEAARLYYPMMYFVDKAHEGPSTCNGDLVGKPMAKVSEDECAQACDDHIHECTGYSYYPTEGGELCFLFSKLKTATAYNCPASFLQLKKKAAAPACKLKMSAYEGTSISPDSDRAKSGKCPGCLKELTKADRCPGK